MKLDYLTRGLSKEELSELRTATRKAYFVYLLTKKRDKEENKILLSCILSYIFVFVMLVVLILLVVDLSKDKMITEDMIKSFVFKCIGLLIFTILFDLLVVGRRWYNYCNMMTEYIRKEADDTLRNL